MSKAQDAITRLKEGNRRFVDCKPQVHYELTAADRREMAKAQEPFAIILCCSDSRVPAEMIFDQGIGQLFVIRIAGNIVAPSQIGSVEFAATQFHTPLVVVLGHSKCGAIKAGLDDYYNPESGQSKNIRSIVDRVLPAVKSCIQPGLNLTYEELYKLATQANVRRSVNQLSKDSPVIQELIQTGELVIVGAEYCIEEGIVEFLDDNPS